MTDRSVTAAVLIGRNEGERLLRCIASVTPVVERVVYVDSGSVDDSVEAARSAGAEVVELDLATPFTAARARNEGAARLAKLGTQAEFIQFIDGDCELQPDWIAKAEKFLHDHPKAAAVCGRRRERLPEATLWNRLIDAEWDTPVGKARACGGDVLIRRRAFDAAGGFNPSLIAGEEPELCVRLRQADWEIWRIDAEMTLHDAAMTQFGQWWRRARRAGHAYAEGAALHGAPPERHKVAELRRALLWGVALPVIAIVGAFLASPWALGLLLAYPLQVIRLALKGCSPEQAIFLTISKLPEAQGALDYYLNGLTGRRRGLIEYK